MRIELQFSLWLLITVSEEVPENPASCLENLSLGARGLEARPPGPLSAWGLRASAHISVASFWASGPGIALSMERDGKGLGVPSVVGVSISRFLKFLVLGVPWLRQSSQKVFPSDSS